MKIKKVVFCITMASLSICSMQGATSAIVKDMKMEKKIEKTLSKMTLEEKIGQMTELAIDVLGEMKDGHFELDDSKIHEAIAVYKVGSFLNAPGPVALSKERWNEIIERIQTVSMKEIGILCIYGLE